MPGQFSRSAPQMMQNNRPIHMPRQMHFAMPPLMPPMPTAIPWMPRPPQYMPRPPQYMPRQPQYMPRPPQYMPRPPQCMPRPPYYLPPPPGMFRARLTGPRPMRSPCGFHHCSQRVISPLEREMREQGLFNCCPSIMPIYVSENDIYVNSMQLRMTVAQMERNANNNLRNSCRTGVNINADTQREHVHNNLTSEMVRYPRERLPRIGDLQRDYPMDHNSAINHPMDLNTSGRRATIENLLRDISGNAGDPGSLLWNLPSTNNSIPENNYVEWAQAYALGLLVEEPLGHRSSVNGTVYDDELRTFFNIEHVRDTMRAALRATNAHIPEPSPKTVSNRNYGPMEDPMPSVNGFCFNNPTFKPVNSGVNNKVVEKENVSPAKADNSKPSTSIAPKLEAEKPSIETIKVPTSLATIQETSEPPSDSASKQETSQPSSDSASKQETSQPSSSDDSQPTTSKPSSDSASKQETSQPSSSDDSQPTTSKSSQNNGSATKQQAKQNNILVLDGNSNVPESPPLKRRLRPRGYTQSFGIVAPNKRNKNAAKANEAVANTFLSLFEFVNPQ